MLTFTIFQPDLFLGPGSEERKLKIKTDSGSAGPSSPDGKTIALGSVENKVRLFNVATQTSLAIWLLQMKMIGC